MSGYKEGIHFSIPVSILIALAIGFICGLVNGCIITRLKLSPFIVTLAAMSTIRGLALLYSNGIPVSRLPAKAVFLGRGYIGFIPIPVIVMAVVVTLTWVALSCMSFGRHVQAIGSNEECARLSGIKVNRTKISVYIISGACAAITGILLTMRLGSGQPTVAEGMEMDSITAVVLGGTSINGGKGYMLGTIIGCLFLAFLGNGFNIIGISSFWQRVFKGIILVIAIGLYNSKKK
jgi:ribose transport system permease protein